MARLKIEFRGIYLFLFMEISVCIVLMVVSLLIGGLTTYFWLSRKYAQEISGLESEVLEVQRKGNHYRENIEDKLLHAQNAAEDRKRELLASVQSQKNTENKYQQSQSQLKEKNTQINEANAELKKLRKENDKINKENAALTKEKAGFLAEKANLLAETEKLSAENEFWLMEFDAKKHLLMGDDLAGNTDFSQEQTLDIFEQAQNEDVTMETEHEHEFAVAANYHEEEGEELIQADSPNLLNEVVMEVEEPELVMANESVEIPQQNLQNIEDEEENENISFESNHHSDTIIKEEQLAAETQTTVNEEEPIEETIIMAYPFMEEGKKLAEIE